MDYAGVKIPFLSDAAIKRAADLFRGKYWNNEIPVEVEDILDFKMEIQIIPVRDLMKLCFGDAFITSNWNYIYVDDEKYSDERYKNRLRFSLAHELGHFILHKDIYRTFDIKELVDFYKFMDNIPQKQYSYLEAQANNFAGHLLIPRDKLLIEKEKVVKSLNNDLSKIDPKLLNSFLAIPLSSCFGVSEEAVEIALNYTENVLVGESPVQLRIS